jgi:hypothetical protein
VPIALVLCLSALLVSVVYAGATSDEHMSDAHYGPPVTQFPTGTAVVYVVFDYSDMQNEEITVKVWSPIGELLFEQTQAYSGSDTESIEVTDPEGGAFPDGRYATNFYRGILPYKTLIWDVGEVTTPTPTQTSTPTPTSTATPGPVVTVSPAEGHAGQEFTFTGSYFTPNGLVHEGFDDPYQGYHYHGSFYTDSSGEFVRTIASETDWLGGVYAYVAFDSIKDYNASVEFTVIGPTPTPTATATVTPTASPSYEVYLPIMVKNYVSANNHWVK